MEGSGKSTEQCGPSLSTLSKLNLPFPFVFARPLGVGGYGWRRSAQGATRLLEVSDIEVLWVAGNACCSVHSGFGRVILITVSLCLTRNPDHACE